MANSTKRPRGFAAMDRNRQREIARMGGRAAHLRGTAHEFSPEEARQAGRLGGQASHGGRGGKHAPSADTSTKPGRADPADSSDTGDDADRDDREGKRDQSRDEEHRLGTADDVEPVERDGGTTAGN